MSLTRDERYVVWAALAAMVADVHAPQDQLSDEQWALAEALFDRIADAVEVDGIGR